MRSACSSLIVLNLRCSLTHLLLLSCTVNRAHIVSIYRLLVLDNWLRRLLFLEFPDSAADIFALELMNDLILSIYGELVLSVFEQLGDLIQEESLVTTFIKEL